MHRLLGRTQHYEWGHPSVIPAMLGDEPDGRPHAEYWMGAHPKAPSTVQRHDEPAVELGDLILDDPLGVMGRATVDQFGLDMPFLFKVLAADAALSIQTHPSAEQARVGFEREEREGPAVTAPDRVFRDPRHKPELIAALTPFEALCGFRSIEEITQRCSDLGGLDVVIELLKGNGEESERIASALSTLLVADHAFAAPLIEAAMHDPVVARIAEHHADDPGLVVSLFLNHVELEPGQALFLQAGNLHAYVRGVGMELMANSDNVVRGGLTPKHIDVPELLRVTTFTPGAPPVQSCDGQVHTYASPVPEFSLTRVAAGPTVPFEASGPEIIFVSEGGAQIRCSDGDHLFLQPGQAAFVSAADGAYTLRSDGLAWRATAGF